MNNENIEANEEKPVEKSKTPAQKSKEKEKKIIHFLKVIVMSILCVVAFSLLILFFRSFFGGEKLAGAGYASVLDGPVVTPAYESVESSLAGLHLTIKDPSPTPAPEIDMNNTKFRDYGEKMVIGNAAYDSFSINNDESLALANAINSSVESLPSGVNFFSIVVPTAVDVMLPKEFKEDYSDKISNQGVAIDNINSFINHNVAAMDIYDTLLANSDQKLYNKTDTNWTSLASYYAYTVWANRKSVDINTLEDYEPFTVEGFSGSLYAFIGSSQIESPEAIVYYKPISNLTTGSSKSSIFKDVEESSSSKKTDVFLGGETDHLVINNFNLSDKSVGVIIGDKTAYSLVPYLAEYYETTYFFDYTQYEGSVIATILDTDAADVTFCVSIETAKSQSNLEKLSKMH